MDAIDKCFGVFIIGLLVAGLAFGMFMAGYHVGLTQGHIEIMQHEVKTIQEMQHK